MESNGKYRWAQYRTLLILAICNFISAVVYSVQAPFYPEEAEKKNATATEYGIVFGIYELTMFISCPLIPAVMDKIGPYTIFHGGIYLVSLSVIAFGFLDRIYNHGAFIILSIILRIFEAIGAALVFTTNYSFVMELFPEAVATVFAILETMFASGMAAGPPVGGLFYQLGGESFGFTLPFLVLGFVLSTLTIFTFHVLPRDKNGTQSQSQTTRHPSLAAQLEHSASHFQDKPTNGFKFLTLLKIPIVQLYAFNVMSVAIAAGFLTSTLEPHIRQFDLTPIQVGAIFLLYGGVYALTASTWGYICDNASRPEYIPIIGSICVFISFMFIGPVPCLGINTSIYLIAGSLILFGMGLGAVYVSCFLLILQGAKKYEIFEDNCTSYVSGLWLSSMSFGAFLGPILGGFLFQHVGFQNETLFVEVLFIIIISALIFVTIFKRNSKNHRQPYHSISNENGIQDSTSRLNYNSGTIKFSQSCANLFEHNKEPLLPNFSSNSLKIEKKLSGYDSVIGF